MNITGLIGLLLAHFITGWGLLRIFKISLPPLQTVCLSLIAGVPVLALAPCLLQLMNIPIDAASVSIAILVITLGFGLPGLRQFRHWQRPAFTWPQLYEWPFIAVFATLLLLSAWRCFYFPPTPYDMISGPELIAEYTVREHTMINSVFSIDLHASNNHFKSPFITGLQIIYKLLVSPFGQVWLAVLYSSFITWLYCVARERIHPLLAGLLVLFFISIPDLYAYSFLMLYDYSNMIFFFAGVYFYARYLSSRQANMLAFAALLLGMATYIRTETLLLVALLWPVVTFTLLRQQLPARRVAVRSALFIAVPALFYFLCINVFVKMFVPLSFDVGSQVNPSLADLGPFFARLSDMATQLLFSGFGLGSYGYFVYVFLAILIVDLAWLRRFNTEARIALLGVAVVYIGLAFIGYLLPLADLMNTTKRGLFKLFPFMLLYICNSGLIQLASGKIQAWENRSAPGTAGK
jgi:hypothetical protein